METEQAILTRGLPKTGQTVVYQAGDDGTYQAGWWDGRKIADNKTRFIAQSINGDKVVIDRATGLMWAAEYDAAGGNNGLTRNWVIQLQAALVLDFAGFSDWHMPNVFELLSIMDYSLTNPAIDTNFFTSPSSGQLWCSTTYLADTLNALYIDITVAILYYRAKTESAYLRAVRGGV